MQRCSFFPAFVSLPFHPWLTTGYVTCNRGYSGDSRPWNACNPSHGDVYSFELRLDGMCLHLLASDQRSGLLLISSVVACLMRVLLLDCDPPAPKPTGTFIADAPAWGVLPSNCDKPSSLRGDIYCGTHNPPMAVSQHVKQHTSCS